MNETHASTTDHHKPELVEIRVKGHLDNRWANWFEGMTISREDNGNTLLTGPVVDQAALHGLLKKVRDLGIALISVNCAKSSDADTSNDTSQDKTSL